MELDPVLSGILLGLAALAYLVILTAARARLGRRREDPPKG